jgi:hypothetical protein
MTDAGLRRLLAVGIVVLSMVVIAVVAIVAIYSAPAGAERAEMSRLAMSAVIPLLGTWVGTVLAFYFARENLQAATENTLRLQGRDSGRPVREVMIRPGDITSFTIPAGSKIDDVPISELRTEMGKQSPPSRRLPICDATGAVHYVIHDSTLNAFSERKGTPPETLGDLLGDTEFKGLISAIGFVAEDATISDARTVMAATPNCNDIFVTKDGKPNESVAGWLTNTLLAEIQ